METPRTEKKLINKSGRTVQRCAVNVSVIGGFIEESETEKI